MSTATPSIWDTLGVPANATETEIRRAYAQRLKITRPDDDPVAFQALREAYERARQIAQARAAREAREAHEAHEVHEVHEAPARGEAVGQTPPAAADAEAEPLPATSVPDGARPPAASDMRGVIQPPRAPRPPEALQPPETPVPPGALQPPKAPRPPDALQAPEAPTPPDALQPPKAPRPPDALQAPEALQPPEIPPVAQPPRPPEPAPPAAIAAPNEIAQAAWQRFIASRRGPPAQPIALAILLRDDALTHLAARDAFELLCAHYCAGDNADPALRIEIADIMEWERDSSFILRALPHVGRTAMARVQADRLVRSIEHRLPKAFALLSKPPVSPQRARLMLLSSRRVAQLSRALAILRGHPQHVVAYRFALPTLAFWDAQCESRLTPSSWLPGAVLVSWLAAIVWVAAGPFRLLTWAPPWATFAALPIAAGAALVTPVLALLFWPDRARRWYRRIEDRPLFRYGWIGLWTIASIALMEGRLHDLQGVQLGGMLGLIAAFGWAMAAVPASLYSMSLICSPMLAPLFGTQALYAHVFGAQADYGHVSGARSVLWSLIQGPLILALLPVQTSLSLALRTHPLAMRWMSAAWWAIVAILLTVVSMASAAEFTHAVTPFALPLFVAAALSSISVVEWGQPRRHWLLFAALIPLAVVPAIESCMLFVWPVVAAVSLTYALRKGSPARAAELRARWLASRPYRYRVRSGWHRPATTLQLRVGVAVLTFVALWMVSTFVAINIGATSPRADGHAQRAARFDLPYATRPAPKLDMPGPQADAPASAPASAPEPRVLHLRGSAALHSPDCRLPAPEYPALARRRGLSGRVVVRVVLSPQGLPESASIVQGSQHDELDEAARRAALAITCEPYLVQGKAVRAKVSIPFTFALRDE
ncbi:TonB family protein [Burkholderia sp. Ac-20379]|uniref:TonB family protein n=1 Tax=Burkholderia sp. Ac-20379 TaxID=2703900 RepID=UPI0019820485|nr:TonB family protein [Burkholderia sp. Ac-20379]MBN3726944.1 TonB family protein [Burkholderia sp. Ac-20379]